MAIAQQRPFSINVFVPDGDPDGLRIVEKSNWTGVGVVFNRTNYKQIGGRGELNKTGVYVLVGSTDGSNLPTIYVGEGDPVKNRLNQHYAKRDFWDWAVFFVSKDNSLNKAHVQHLESRLLELARMAKQCRIENNQEPIPPTLSEAQTAGMESFLLDMLSIFPLLGLGIFEKTEAKKPAELLGIESKGVRANGYEDAKGFVVCKGSQAVREEVASIHQYMSTLRRDLLAQGVMAESGQHLVFVQDQVFNSPSTADRFDRSYALGVDVASGGADDAIWVVLGRYRVREIVAKRTPDTAKVAGVTRRLMYRWRVAPRAVAFDAGGGSQQIADALADRWGWEVSIVDFGAKPIRPAEYRNRRTELYGELRNAREPKRRLRQLLAVPAAQWTRKQRCVSLPPDVGRLRDELAVLPKWYDGEGRLVLRLPSKSRSGARSGDRREPTIREPLGGSSG